MSTPTAQEILDAAAQNAADGVQSAQADGQSATAMDPIKQLQAADRIAAQKSASGTNANGGPKSGWGMCRNARAIPPGAA
jgi:hypothetical protein